ncbi:DEAD/DEAH box helicase [Faunimonas sp. B44]|uniref:DEAD/DEAH box helicase n=1 Tax=Faunimonas sp. B44 TaxID=3461493 RepID=UPI0040439E73
MAFLPASPALARALAERNYTEATPVQDAVLAEEAAGRDLLVSARTGSGKTVAYGLAIGATLLGDAETLPAAGAPLALVVAPTRELALQVQNELAWLYAFAGARVISCVGGMDPRREARRLADGAHIVVGTPGRLRDHLERGALDISGIRAVVLDEADEMLDLGFREDLEFILEATPPERRTLLFSATLPKAITTLARRYQRDTLRMEVSGGERGHADIEYRAVRVAPNEIEHAVVNLLRFFEAPSALVFCNTRDSVRRLQAALSERGFAVVALSGELSQSERNHALQAMRDGRARVCVATDVAARGIDLPELDLVVHADLPHDAETLQHRSGRTGRAGRKGVSVLLVPLKTRNRAERLLGGAGAQAIWSGPPTADEVRRLDQERLLQDSQLLEEASEEELATARLLIEGRSAEEIATALVRLYRSRLPAAEEVYDPGPQRPARTRGEDGPQPGAPRERRERTAGAGASVWFRLDIGRRNNADPRWLVPLICRRGKITKAEIGAIRIFERETKFEIAEEVAGRFAEALAHGPDDNVRIEPVAGAARQGPRRPSGAKAGPRKDTARPGKPRRQG